MLRITMRPSLATALLAGLLSAGSLAAAASAAEPTRPFPFQTEPNPDAAALLCATIQRLVEALGQALQDVPRYAAPEMDNDGNIILRRLNPPPASPHEPPPVWDMDQAST